MDEQGGAIADAAVDRVAYGFASWVATSDDSGPVTVPTEQGVYAVEAVGYARRLVDPPVEKQGGDPRSIVLLPERRVSGRVVGRSGEPVATARVHAIDPSLEDDPRFEWRLDGEPRNHRERARELAWTRTDALGRFTLRCLPDRPLLLRVETKAGLTEQEIDARATAVKLEVEPAKPRVRLRVEVHAEGSDTRLPGAEVWIAACESLDQVAKEPSRSIVAQTVWQRATEILPGLHQWQTTDRGPWRIRVTHPECEEFQEELSIDGEQLDRVVELDLARRVQGMLTGIPLAELEDVRLTCAGSVGGPRDVVLREDGGFEISLAESELFFGLSGRHQGRPVVLRQQAVRPESLDLREVLELEVVHAGRVELHLGPNGRGAVIGVGHPSYRCEFHEADGTVCRTLSGPPGASYELELPLGTYTLLVFDGDREFHRQSVTVREDRTTAVNVPLEEL